MTRPLGNEPEPTMKEVRLSQVAIAAGVVLALTSALFAVIRASDGVLPQNSWLVVAVLLVAGALVLLAANDVRRYLKGDMTRRPSAMRARRTVVAAQAVALGGGALSGFYAAGALFRVRDSDVESIRNELILSLVLVVAALLLAGAGLLAQAWCKIPEPPEGGDGAGAPDDGVLA